MSKPATHRHDAFAREYCVDRNATQAAIRAGYSRRTARQQGSRLLSNAAIAAQIEAISLHHAQKVGITHERTLQHLAASAYFDPRRMFRPDSSMKPPSEWDDETAAGIASIETDETVLKPTGEVDDAASEGAEYVEKIITRKVKSWNKIQALELCAEILGMKKTLAPGESGGLSITFVPSTEKRARAGDSGPPAERVSIFGNSEGFT